MGCLPLPGDFFSSITADFNISSALRWAIQDQWSSGFNIYHYFTSLKHKSIIIYTFCVHCFCVCTHTMTGRWLTFWLCTHCEGVVKPMQSHSFFRRQQELLLNILKIPFFQLQCCGVHSYNDWEMNLYFNCTSYSSEACGVPFSCCRPTSVSIVVYTFVQWLGDESVF